MKLKKGMSNGGIGERRSTLTKLVWTLTPVLFT